MVKKKKNIRKTFTSPFNFIWDKTNIKLLIGGSGLIILGFFLMSVKPFDSFLSLYISPLVLVLAYAVIIPFAILYKKKSAK